MCCSETSLDGFLSSKVVEGSVVEEGKGRQNESELHVTSFQTHAAGGEREKKKTGSEALKKLVFKLLLFSPEEVKVAYEAARRKWVGE